jgi:hypothetical protein
MKLEKNISAFHEACLDAPFNTVCVKLRGKSLQELFNEKCGHGILVSPVVMRGPQNTATSLNEYMATLPASTVVKVRGHGWSFEEPFVWTGSPREFNQTWEID